MNKLKGGVLILTKKEISNIVSHLVEMYNTHCPFEICKKMNINILFLDLPDTVEGFFVNSEKLKGKSYISILINKSMPKCNYNKICAHELGHVLLHNNVNSEVCKDNRDICLEDLEKEAEIFSKTLLSKNKII